MPALDSRPGSDARPAPTDGALHQIDVQLLDDNPYQPRSSIDEAKLAELAASIAASGLLQPIAVRPASGGRYQIVAGHRRVAAFRKLKEEATTDDERRRYRLIAATVKRSFDDRQMAVGAYVENASRSDLSPLEEAAALLQIKDLVGASNAKELAAAVGQNEQRVRRLFRLAEAPQVVKDAVTNGLLVEVERAAADSPGRRERRRLDLLAALEFARLHDHVFARKPGTADERIASAIRRAFADNWGLRRIQDHVEQVIAGRETREIVAGGGLPAAASLVERTRDRFVVHLKRAAQASADQRAEAAQALRGLAQELESIPTASGEGQ